MKNYYPKISVIVPVYNVEQYLEKCINSILNQTYKNIEIIFIDDGSTDSSGHIIEQYKMLDPRVIVVHKKNEGSGAARNTGLAIATGDYIGFVDSDDHIELDMYESLIRATAEHPSSIVMCGRYNERESDGMITPFFTRPEMEEWDQKESIRRFLIWDGIDSSVWDKLFPTSLIKSKRFPSGYVSEDMPFMFDMLMNCESVMHIAVAKYYYLERSGSLSRPISFTNKNIGLVKYPKEISEKVLDTFPELYIEANYFYLSRLIIMYSFLTSVKHCGEYKQNVLIDIRKNISRIIMNNHFSFMDKFKAVLIALHLYDFVYLLYKRTKGEWK